MNGVLTERMASASSRLAPFGQRLGQCWVVVILACLVAARGEAQGPARGSRPTPLTETAAALAEQGFARGDARAILAAARIMAVVEVGSPRVRPTSPATGPAGPWEGILSRRSLLLLSSRVAADHGDWEIADLVAKELGPDAPDPAPPTPTPSRPAPASPPSTRGAAGGPIWADAFVAAGGEKVYTIEFEGGGTPNLLQISAGKPAATLECTLHDPAITERPAVRVRSVSGSCTLQWKQAMQGQVTLRIRNRGPDAFFVLSSN